MKILFFSICILLVVIAIYVKRTIFAKERALKVMNKIVRMKFSDLCLKELVNLICQNLHDDLKKKFTIILSDDDGGVEIYGDLQLYQNYEQKIIEVLKDPRRFYIKKGGRVLHFYPLKISNKGSGIFLAEVSFYDDFILNFSQILPLVADQIFFILENFKTQTLLSEMKINKEREKLRALILSSISHDLKTPLSSIIGGLTIYNKLNTKDKLSKDDQHALISIALDEAKRLHQFISDILEMTKIKSGAITLHKQFFDPISVIKKVLHRFQLKLRDYEVDLSLKSKVHILFDPTSFEQIIQNLLDNSVKYSDRNTKITIREELDEKNLYRIFIQDEGNGIDPEKLDSIFDEFERFTDKGTGNGLGLSIVKALTEANNAKISVKNVTEKKGIIFILQFHEFQKIS